VPIDGPKAYQDVLNAPILLHVGQSLLAKLSVEIGVDLAGIERTA